MDLWIYTLRYYELYNTYKDNVEEHKIQRKIGFIKLKYTNYRTNLLTKQQFIHLFYIYNTNVIIIYYTNP